MANQTNPFPIIIVGAVMLMIGISIGYLGAQYVAAPPAEEAARADSTTPEVGVTAPSEPAGSNTEVVTDTSDPATAAAPETAAPPDPTESLAERQDLMNMVVPNTRHFKGDPNAPVTIVEFSDFQCPYCSRFAVEAGRELDDTYIADGTVRFGYQHFVFLGDQSIWAAEASECAAEQDAFWPYHDRLVERVAIENQRDFTRETLKTLAQELGLETTAFNECLDSGRYTDLVLAETQNAQQLGVRSTPTFLINGLPITGAQPFDVFERAVELVKNDAQS